MRIDRLTVHYWKSLPHLRALLLRRPLSVLLLSLFMSMLLAIAGRSAGTEGNDARELTYAAIIGTAADNFDTARDPLISMAKGTFGGPLVLWVNGDPVDLYAGELQIKALNLWLRPGANELTFSGRHSLPVYLSMVKGSQSQKDGTNIAKRKFEPQDDDGKHSQLKFQMDEAPRLPERERLSTKPEDRKTYQKDIEAGLSELKQLLQKHKGREAAALLTAGQRLWGEELGRKPSSRQEKVVTFLSASQTKISGADRPVKMVFGERAVLVYGVPSKENANSFHLLTARRGTEEIRLWPLQFARVKGKWIVWNSE